MDRRSGSSARLLAPISLIAFVLALFIVIAGSDTGGGGGDHPRITQKSGGGDSTQSADQTEPRVPGRFYTVKTGDTLAAIAETVGIPVERLQELNPDLDPQALVSGQKIRLRE